LNDTSNTVNVLQSGMLLKLAMQLNDSNNICKLVKTDSAEASILRMPRP